MALQRHVLGALLVVAAICLMFSWNSISSSDTFSRRVMSGYTTGFSDLRRPSQSQATSPRQEVGFVVDDVINSPDALDKLADKLAAKLGAKLTSHLVNRLSTPAPLGHAPKPTLRPSPAPTVLPSEATLQPSKTAAEGSPSEGGAQPKAVLYLKKELKVFVLTVESDRRQNDRDVKMIREGIRMHPKLTMANDTASADFVLWCLWGDRNEEVLKVAGAPKDPHLNDGEITIANQKKVARHKLLVLDFSDGKMRLPWVGPQASLAYFKRSMVGKVDGTLTGTAHACSTGDEQPCFPLDYAVRPINFHGLRAETLSNERNISLVFLVDSYKNIGETMIAQVSSARVRVKEWLLELNATAKLPQGDGKVIIGYIHSHGDSGGKKVLNTFRHADVVVVADPSSYEGQHAIYEAMGSGAVILANRRWVPLPDPLVENKHLHFYDACDTAEAKAAFHKLVLHVLTRSKQRQHEMRTAGWSHVISYHQAVNRVDYVLRTVVDAKFDAGSRIIKLDVPAELQVSASTAEAKADMKRCVEPVEEMRRKKIWLTGDHQYLNNG